MAIETLDDLITFIAEAGLVVNLVLILLVHFALATSNSYSSGTSIPGIYQLNQTQQQANMSMNVMGHALSNLTSSNCNSTIGGIVNVTQTVCPTATFLGGVYNAITQLWTVITSMMVLFFLVIIIVYTTLFTVIPGVFSSITFSFIGTLVQIIEFCVLTILTFKVFTIGSDFARKLPLIGKLMGST